MIMRGNTPKSLSPTGWLVLLGLALFLLPVVPAQAQVQRDDKRDQEIKALKERLRSLEDERAAQRAKAEFTGQTKEPPPEVQEVIRAAAELKGQIAKKRAELQDLEAKLNHLLQKVDGYKDLKGSKFENLKNNLDAEKLKYDALVRDKETIIKQYKQQAEEQQLRATEALQQAKEHILLERRKAAEMEKHYKDALNAQQLDKAKERKAVELYEKAVSADYVNKLKKDPKSASLEERLEHIMKEVAELRQEMINMQRQQKLAPDKK